MTEEECLRHWNNQWLLAHFDPFPGSREGAEVFARSFVFSAWVHRVVRGAGKSVERVVVLSVDARGEPDRFVLRPLRRLATRRKDCARQCSLKTLSILYSDPQRELYRSSDA